MLTTDEHGQDHHDEPDDTSVPVRLVTAGEIPHLFDAVRTAVHAAQLAADALLAHGIGHDRVSVAASLTEDGQPLVLITTTPPGGTHDHGLVVADPHQWLTHGHEHPSRRTNVGGGAGGPPTRGTNPTGRAA